jgi:hypothetical protein
MSTLKCISRVVLLGLEHADDARGRFLGAGVDNASGRPVRPAELSGADNRADRDERELRHPGRRYRCAAGANASELTSLRALLALAPRRGAANRSRTLARRASE